MSRHLAALLVPLALAGALAGAALAAGEYGGAARAVAITPREAGFKGLAQSVPAPRPAADKRRGYKSGWQAVYLKGTAAQPLQAVSVVYVYRTAADARRAWNRSCAPCRRGVIAEGIRMKYQLRSTRGTQTLINVAQCRNVYLAVVLNGKQKGPQLAREAGAIIGATYRRAAAKGMRPCSAG